MAYCTNKLIEGFPDFPWIERIPRFGSYFPVVQHINHRHAPERQGGPAYTMAKGCQTCMVTGFGQPRVLVWQSCAILEKLLKFGGQVSSEYLAELRKLVMINRFIFGFSLHFVERVDWLVQGK